MIAPPRKTIPQPSSWQEDTVTMSVDVSKILSGRSGNDQPLTDKLKSLQDKIDEIEKQTIANSTPTKQPSMIPIINRSKSIHKAFVSKALLAGVKPGEHGAFELDLIGANAKVLDYYESFHMGCAGFTFLIAEGKPHNKPKALLFVGLDGKKSRDESYNFDVNANIAYVGKYQIPVTQYDDAQGDVTEITNQVLIFEILADGTS